MSQQQIKSKIIEYYKDILCREPDEEGLDLYLKMANNGTSLEKIRELFLESDEYDSLKSANFLKHAPSFKTSFSDDEVKKMFGSVDWWYHYFKIGNVENTNTKTSRNYQMWVSSIIPENLENKTVLDIGTADGYYSFLCESRGAKKVVAVDWTEFPGFTVTHKVLNSKVEFRKLVIDDSTIGFTKIKSQVGTIDEIKEKFDVVLLFGVLYHIPSPIMVIQKLFKNTSMLLIASHIIDSKEPAMYYYPEYSLTPGDTTNWWVPTPSCLTDIGNINSVANSYLRFEKPRSFFAAMSWGNCGYAFPTIVGAKAAAQHRPAVSYAGDGAWAMSMVETMTCVRHDIPVTAVVFHNRHWGAEKKNQVDFYDRRFVAAELTDQNFVDIAKSMGAEGIRVDRLEDVGPALKKAIDMQMNERKTTIIEIMCTRELGDPFRKDALSKPVRHLAKYKNYGSDTKHR